MTIEEQNEKRKPGYYWITAWKERMIAEWNGDYWHYCGSDMSIPEVAITNVNEKEVVEDASR